MGGSTLKVNVPGVQEGQKHNTLTNRELPLQHPFESIYRTADGKDLLTVLQEMSSVDKSVKWEMVVVATEGQTVIDLTKFQYDMARDELFVEVQGIDVYEGTEQDYVKTAPTQITFNYGLHSGYEVCIVLAGTISNASFGDDIYNSISQFKQLLDTPKSYYSHGGQYLKVNDSETGLIFSSSVGVHRIQKIETEYTLVQGQKIEEWINFFNNGIIKAIKVTPICTETTDLYLGDFRLSLWTEPSGYWIYYSGEINEILWDIMDIPHIDESGQDCIYLRLEHNIGPTAKFKLQIFYES